MGRGRKPGEKSNGDHGPELFDLPGSASQQLSNRKHELFARYVSQGETYSHAYELAGYLPSTANASTLAKRPEVSARIAVLKQEKEERDLRFRIELQKANLDPDDPVRSSREVAEWTAKQVLDLFWENARLAQMAGQFSTANDSLKTIAEIMGLRGSNNSGTGKNDKSPATQVGIAIYQDAVKQLGQGGGVSLDGGSNPLAPRISGPKNSSSDG
jgi:hypothetical protein